MSIGEKVEGKAANGLSRLGRLLRSDALVYNPLQMRLYHRRAVDEAPRVIGAFLAVFPGLSSVVDVGAGTGIYMAEAARRGLSVAGCEHSGSGRRRALSLGVDSRPFDLTREPPSELEGPFDVAYCIEVAEHLPPPLGDRLVSFVAALAPVVVWTAATPGQGGLGHINEQPAVYWDERFKRLGHTLDLDATGLLHDEFVRRGVVAHWLLNNARVYRGQAKQA